MTEELRYLAFAEGGTANLTIKIAMIGMPGLGTLASHGAREHWTMT